MVTSAASFFVQVSSSVVTSLFSEPRLALIDRAGTANHIIFGFLNPNRIWEPRKDTCSILDTIRTSGRKVRDAAVRAAALADGRPDGDADAGADAGTDAGAGAERVPDDVRRAALGRHRPRPRPRHTSCTKLTKLSEESWVREREVRIVVIVVIA